MSNENNNSQEFEFERESRSASNSSREANRSRKNEQIRKNETRSAQHSSSGVSVGMTKPPIKPSFIIAAATIFLVVVISIIFIVRSLPTTEDTTTADTGETTKDTGSDTTKDTTSDTTSTEDDQTTKDTGSDTTKNTTSDSTSDTTGSDTTSVQDTTTGGEDLPPDPVVLYQEIAYANTNLSSGYLAMISKTNPAAVKEYDEKDLDALYPQVYKKFSFIDGLRVVGFETISTRMEINAMKALDDMLYDFIKATGGFNEATMTRVGKPVIYKNCGYDISDPTSERALGTSVHLKVTLPDGNTSTLDGAEGHDWIYENAYKYGYILRYPEDKEEFTGSFYEPGIFRYVGIVHATAMKNLGMCFEEYMAALKGYTVEDPYTVTCANEAGEEESYLIYYVEADTSADTTTIKIYENTPEGSYTISGDNVSGYVVTIKE